MVYDFVKKNKTHPWSSNIGISRLKKAYVGFKTYWKEFSEGLVVIQ